MTNPNITIVDTTATHLRIMAEVMREDTKQTALKLGISPRKALWKSWKESIICKTAFINNEIAAIWGLGGSCFTDIGMPWLVLAPCTDEYPFKVAFAFRRELERMQYMYPELQDFVDCQNERAIRLLKLMGFQIGCDIIKRGECGVHIATRRRK